MLVPTKMTNPKKGKGKGKGKGKRGGKRGGKRAVVTHSGMTASASVRSNPASKKKNAKRRKNPAFDWKETGIAAAGVAAGAYLSNRIRTFVADLLARFNIAETKTLGYLKIASGFGIVALADYVNASAGADVKKLPLLPFAHAAAGATMEDGFTDIRSASEDTAAPESPTTEGRRRIAGRRFAGTLTRAPIVTAPRIAGTLVPGTPVSSARTNADAGRRFTAN